MENATEALLMAGKVLIALMIISSLVYMFSNLTNYQNTRISEKRTTQVIEFNRQFENYNRPDVRGNDLYSLINRIADYNVRKTDDGYTEMKLNINFPEDSLKKFSIDSENLYLFKQNTYTDKNINPKIVEPVRKIEEKVGKTEIDQLTKAKEVLFIRGKADDEYAKLTAMNMYIRLFGKDGINGYGDVERALYVTEKFDGKTLEDLTKEYYEFIQFKRAHFDCQGEPGKSGVKYDENSGRIIEMNFVFNGKIS